MSVLYTSTLQGGEKQAREDGMGAWHRQAAQAVDSQLSVVAAVVLFLFYHLIIIKILIIKKFK
jgi:hypothetical protein